MERQLLEVGQEDSDVRFRHLITCIADGVVVVNHHGVICFVNPAAERLLQWTANELIGALFGFPVVVGETTELDIVASSGDLTVAEMRVVDLLWEGESAYLASLRDITDRKRTEEALRQREEQLRQFQNMEAVGRLAGGMAHEFNNLLTSIMVYSNWLQKHLDDRAVVRQCSERISCVADCAALVVQQLLAFSCHQPLQLQSLNWNVVIEAVEKLVQLLLGDSITLVQHLASDLWQVQADPIQLQQILMNLVLNARDAMAAMTTTAQGGELILTTANVNLEEKSTDCFPERPPGPYVMLEVRDTGTGMDREVYTHLFEPFFTTKDMGNSTGLGLAVVYGIVQQSHGTITVDSTPANGTTFRVYLPRGVAPPAAAPLDVSTGQLAVNSATILLVEDEELVRELLCEMLQLEGYCVLEAAQGYDALALCAQQDGVIDLLVTDVVMPHMNGYDLAGRLATVYPDMRVLLMSGYVGEAPERYHNLPRHTVFLQKPFTPDVLTAKVRDAFDAR